MGVLLEDKELNIMEHLDELRKRLIIIVVSFLVFLIVGFIFVEDIYKWFIKDLDVTLMVFGPSDIVWIYFMLAAVIAVAATIPILAFQVWLFVKPALKTHELKVALRIYQHYSYYLSWDLPLDISPFFRWFINSYWIWVEICF